MSAASGYARGVNGSLHAAQLLRCCMHARIQQAPWPGPGPQVGDHVTVADIALASVLAPLFSSVLGKPLQAHYARTLAWLQSCCTQPNFAKALGE